MPARKTEPRVQVHHPRSGTKPFRISAARYYDIKGAILRALGEESGGIAFADLAPACAGRINSPLWENASLGWYVTSVKLDLESRGLIHRRPGKGRQQVLLGPGSR